MKILEKKEKPITIEDVKEVLKDHIEYPDSICRHDNPKVPEGLRMGTVFSMIVNLGTGDIYFCKGNPCEYELDNLIGAPLLENLVRKGQKIVIVTSDISRPMPSYEVLPGVLDRLYKAGITRQDITVVLALGSHRRHTEEEKRKLVGEQCYQEVKCVDSDIEDCVFLRETKNRIPVEITREVVEADFRICLGNIEFHYFAGYSGGAKAIMPGVASYNAIQMNHRLMIQESSCAGRLEGNLLREDIEEAGNIVGIDYIVNVVLDEHKKLYIVQQEMLRKHTEMAVDIWTKCIAK